MDKDFTNKISKTLSDGFAGLIILFMIYGIIIGAVIATALIVIFT